MVRKNYVDNSIDLSTGCAIDHDGVTKFNFPLFTYCAEKTGVLLLNCVSNIRNIQFYNQIPYTESADLDRTRARRVGAVFIGAVTTAAVLGYGSDALDMVASFPGLVGDTFDGCIREPLRFRTISAGE